MNKETIYSKLRKICLGRWCSKCPIESINPDHKCGNGYGYFLDGNQVPLSEALKYYSIIFGEENLRAIIERRKENDRYERRV